MNSKVRQYILAFLLLFPALDAPAATITAAPPNPQYFGQLLLHVNSDRSLRYVQGEGRVQAMLKSPELKVPLGEIAKSAVVELMSVGVIYQTSKVTPQMRLQAAKNAKERLSTKVFQLQQMRQRIYRHEKITPLEAHQFFSLIIRTGLLISVARYDQNSQAEIGRAFTALKLARAEFGSELAQMSGVQRR